MLAAVALLLLVPTLVLLGLAWLGYVGVLTAVWVVAQILNGLLATPAVSNGWLGTTIWGFIVLTPLVGIPAAVAVAVLRYRLLRSTRSSAGPWPTPS